MRTSTPTLDRPQRDSAAPRPRRTGLLLLAGLVVVGLIAVTAVVLLGGEDAPVVEPSPAPPQTATLPEVRFGEEPRANWDVTGLSAAEELNVHAEPGGHTAIIASLAADAVELESTGRIAWVDGALWREIVVPGANTGWVSR